MVGVFGIQLFRSTNRYSIFILAIVLLFAARRLSALRMPRVAVLVLPLLVAVVGLKDQLPPAPSSVSLEVAAELLDIDREFVGRLEASLPEGAMVFQLPASYFPEASVAGLPAYEHFRPYLFSHALKYSYGHVKGRRLEEWQMKVFEKPVPEAIAEIQKRGFQAITIYRPAFRDHAEGLIGKIEKLGHMTRIDHPDGTLTALIFRRSTSVREGPRRKGTTP
jgi:phosphoglycerol transferase